MFSERFLPLRCDNGKRGFVLWARKPMIIFKITALLMMGHPDVELGSAYTPCPNGLHQFFITRSTVVNVNGPFLLVEFFTILNFFLLPFYLFIYYYLFMILVKLAIYFKIFLFKNKYYLSLLMIDYQ